MIKIECYPLGPLMTNAYVLQNQEDNRAIVIDPGMEYDALLDRLQDVEVEAILLTHAHFDHIGGVDELRKWKSCPVYLHPLEQDWLNDPDQNGSSRWPDIGEPIRTAPPDKWLHEGDTLDLLGQSFEVLHTPGHSPGSVSFRYGTYLFGGDVLFQSSVGRTDLPGGSTQTLYDSIHQKLFVLPSKTIVYPGHGPATTIGQEMQSNPYV